MSQVNAEESLPQDTRYKYLNTNSRNDSNQDYNIYNKSISYRAVYQIEKSYDCMNVLTHANLSITHKLLKTFGFDLMEHHAEASSINQLIPSSSSMKVMHSHPSMWKGLYNNEIKLLSSSAIYDKIQETSKTMSSMVSKLGKLTRTFYVEEYIAKIRKQINELNDNDKMTSSRQDTHLDSKDLENQIKLLSSINSLLLVDEELNHNRHNNFYYNHLRNLPREFTLNAANNDLIYKNKNQRFGLLTFIKQLCKMCNFDKTTYSLTVLVFDSFIYYTKKSYPDVLDNDPIMKNYSNVDNTAQLYNKYAIACLMLIAGLREHWVDMRRDSYLENIITRCKSMFSVREIAKCQMEIIKIMPKGFTNIYTTFEYCLFFLSMLRDIEDAKTKSNNKIDIDGLGLGYLYSFLVKTCSICWIYAIISKWDDLFLFENFNQTITQSRSAAVIFLHIFLDFYQCENDKNILWCRRFSNTVFKMLYDCDLGLWYHSIKSQLSIVYLEIAKSSDTLWKMYCIFKISSAQWCSHLKILAAYKTKTLIEFMETGQKLCELDCVAIANIVPRLIQQVVPDTAPELITFRAKQSIEHTNRVDSDAEEDIVKKRRS